MLLGGGLLAVAAGWWLLREGAPAAPEATPPDGPPPRTAPLGGPLTAAPVPTAAAPTPPAPEAGRPREGIARAGETFPPPPPMDTLSPIRARRGGATGGEASVGGAVIDALVDSGAVWIRYADEKVRARARASSVSLPPSFAHPPEAPVGIPLPAAIEALRAAGWTIRVSPPVVYVDEVPAVEGSSPR